MRTLSADVCVIGLGSGGEQLAKTLADRGRSVVGFESGLVGGECPYKACVPSKSLLHDARVGTRSWSEAVARRHELAHELDDTEHTEGVIDAGVQLERSVAHIVDVNRVEGDGVRVEADHVVIATGSAAIIPGVDGTALDGVWTSADALTSSELPGRLVIVGGGPIGSELGQVYGRYGSTVTLCDMAEQLHPDVEPEIAALLVETLEQSGVTVRLGVELEGIEEVDGGLAARFTDGSTEEGDRILLAVGTEPRLDGLGLESVIDDDVTVGRDGRVNELDWLWAIGDVTGRSHWTHGASYQARHLAATLLGEAWDGPVTIMPDAVFTDPPLGRVGRNSETCRAGGHDVVVGWADYDALPRAATDEVDRGRAAVVIDRPSRRFLGASLHGPRADDLIQVVNAWMAAGATLPMARRTVFPFPTYSQVLELALDDAAANI